MKVSVVVPVYNPALYINSIWRSLLCNVQNIGEVILINNGNDDQFGILEKKLAELGVVMISMQAVKRCGPGPARDLGVASASFPYIAFLDCDDEWHANHLENSLSVLSQASNAAFTYTDFITRNHEGKILTRYKLPNTASYSQLLLTNFLATPSIVIKTKIAKNFKFGNRGHEDLHYYVTLLKSENLIALKNPYNFIMVLRGHQSRSSNKFSAVKWHISRLIEFKISPAFLAVCFVVYTVNALLKRLLPTYTPVGLGFSRLIMGNRRVA